MGEQSPNFQDVAKRKSSSIHQITSALCSFDAQIDHSDWPFAVCRSEVLDSEEVDPTFSMLMHCTTSSEADAKTSIDICYVIKQLLHIKPRSRRHNVDNSRRVIFVDVPEFS